MTSDLIAFAKTGEPPRTETINTPKICVLEPIPDDHAAALDVFANALDQALQTLCAVENVGGNVIARGMSIVLTLAAAMHVAAGVGMEMEPTEEGFLWNAQQARSSVSAEFAASAGGIA